MLRFWIESTAKLFFSKSYAAFLGIDRIRKRNFFINILFSDPGYTLKECLTGLRIK